MADTEEDDSSSDDLDIVDNNESSKRVISVQQDPVRVRVVRARTDAT
jgi:hypothetical protein